MTTPGENTLGKTGKRSTVLNPERELEDPTHTGTSKFPRGTAPLDLTVIHRQVQRSKKSQPPE